MHNLSVNLASAASGLLDPTAATPRTPEILNSLIAMTNPMDTLYDSSKMTLVNPLAALSNSDSNSSCSSQVESPTAKASLSIQHTCSQLIKAGLKLSIEQKRKHNGDGEDLLDLDKCSKTVKKNECSESDEDKNKSDGLTPEDEERRRRRRERNKIAATKCRLKKREKTANLVSESEMLETQNLDLKQQLTELQNQKRNLLDMLNLHRPHCQQNIAAATRESLYRLQQPIDGGNADTYNNSDIYNRFTRNSVNFKTPSIIIEDISEGFQTHLTNLDNQVDSYHYNNQCHNYSNQNYNSTNGMDNGCMA